MGKPLDGIMGSCFVGDGVVTNKILIMLHCWSNVEQGDPFFIPFRSIVIKKNYYCTNGCHWCTVIIKGTMYLVVGQNQRIYPGRSNKVDDNVNLRENKVLICRRE